MDILTNIILPRLLTFAALIPVLSIPYGFALRFVTHKEQREDLVNSFSENTGVTYRSFLKKILNGFDDHINKPFSFRSFCFSLGIAFFYPVIINALLWLVGNYPYQLTGETIFPATSIVNRLMIAIGIFIFIAIQIFLSMNEKEIRIWLDGISLKPKISIIVFLSAVSFLVSVSIGATITQAAMVAAIVAFAFTDALIRSETFAGSFSNSLGFFAFFAVYAAFSFNGSFANGAFIVALIIIFAVFMAFASVLTTTGTVKLGRITGTGTSAFTSTDTFISTFTFASSFVSVVTFLICFLFTVFVVFIDIQNNSTISIMSAILLFFAFLLPLINALFDYVSTSISRTLSRYLVDTGDNWIVVMIWLLFDLILAFWFLIGLVVTLVFTLEVLNQILPSKDTLFPWQIYIEQAKDEPLGAGFFVIFMLYSTLIPTMLHISLGLYSLFFSKLPFYKWLIDRLHQPFDKTYLPKHILQETAVLGSSWFITFMVAPILLSIGLYQLVRFIPAFNDSLYRLAYWASDLAVKVF